MKNRRTHFFIDKPLQLRYMGWLLLFLVLTSLAVILSLHFGVWAKSLEEFSSESVRNALQMATRIQDYQTARYPGSENVPPRLAYIRETDLFSKRQLEIIADILDRTRKRTIALGLALLFFISWSTVFLSHKIAGPFYRLKQSLKILGEKDLSLRIAFRKHDEEQEIAEVFNDAVSQLDEAIARMKREVGKAGDLEGLRRELTRELDHFKTTAR